MSAILVYLNAYVITAFAALIVGVVFSQKIKDWFKGVPAGMRSELGVIEKNAVVELQNLQRQAVRNVLAAASTPPATPPKA